MATFIDRVCSFYQLSVEKRTIANVKTALKEMGLNWNDFPQKLEKYDVIDSIK